MKSDLHTETRFHIPAVSSGTDDIIHCGGEIGGQGARNLNVLKNFIEMAAPAPLPAHPNPAPIVRPASPTDRDVHPQEKHDVHVRF